MIFAELVFAIAGGIEYWCGHKTEGLLWFIMTLLAVIIEEIRISRGKK